MTTNFVTFTVIFTDDFELSMTIPYYGLSRIRNLNSNLTSNYRLIYIIFIYINEFL